MYSRKEPEKSKVNIILHTALSDTTICTFEIITNFGQKVKIQPYQYMTKLSFSDIKIARKPSWNYTSAMIVLNLFKMKYFFFWIVAEFAFYETHVIFPGLAGWHCAW